MRLLFLPIVSFLSKVVLLSMATTSAGNSPENPSAASFLRRAYHSSVVLENYLFIDGGETSQLVDGTSNSDPGVKKSYSRPTAVTLSIDLRSSWTNASLRMKSIPKGAAPLLNNQVLWRKPDGKSCVSWGGDYTSVGDENLPQLKLWNFTYDGSGGGLWTEDTISTAAISKLQLLRPTIGSGTVIGDAGFYVGGIVTKYTDISAAQTPDTVQQGVTAFNFTTGVWSKESSIGLNDLGTTISSRTVFIPALGKDNRGLLFVLGGKDPGLSANTDATDLVPLSNITIYDPYTRRWTAQRATGDIPLERTRFCAVSLQGDNGTYEIFIHGGLNTDTTFDQVYVLSIPGFVWFKASYTPTAPRYQHTCEFAGGRQLIIIGGLDSNGEKKGDLTKYWQKPDPFTQGIGVFDMTALTWKSSYDSNAAKYETPDVIKQWYSAGGLAQVQWQSKEVAGNFVHDAPVSIYPTPSKPATAPKPTNTRQSGPWTRDQKIGIGIGVGIGIPSFVVALITLILKFLPPRCLPWKYKKVSTDKQSVELSNLEDGNTRGDGAKPPSMGIQNIRMGSLEDIVVDNRRIKESDIRDTTNVTLDEGPKDSGMLAEQLPTSPLDIAGLRSRSTF